MADGQHLFGCGCRLLRSGQPSAWRQRPRPCTCHSAPGHHVRAGGEPAVGNDGACHQSVPAKMVGWGRRHLQHVVRLHCHHLVGSARLPVLDVRLRHAPQFGQYGGAERDECGDDGSGRILQFLPHLPHAPHGSAWHAGVDARRRTRSGGCRHRNGFGRGCGSHGDDVYTVLPQGRTVSASGQRTLPADVECGEERHAHRTADGTAADHHDVGLHRHHHHYRSSRHHCHRRQLVRHHRGESLLYARLRRC